MLLVATALMMPMLALGTVFGVPMHGGETQVGIGFAVGALLFGAGMQVGGGCASGTLFSLGGGNAKLVGTVAGFVIGSALGAAHMGFWWSLPALPAYTAQGLLGYGPAIAVQLAVLAVLWLVAGRFSPGRKGMSLLLWGGIALAGLNAATLILSGKPWGETSAFALWGSKAVAALGADAHGWAYWQRPGFGVQLDRSLLLDQTSVMDAAILLGASIMAAAAGLFRPTLGGGGRAWLGAAAGWHRHGVWGAAVERVQHRRLFQRDRRGQSVGLGLDGAGAGGELDRRAAPAAVPVAGGVGADLLTCL